MTERGAPVVENTSPVGPAVADLAEHGAHEITATHWRVWLAVKSAYSAHRRILERSRATVGCEIVTSGPA